MNQHFYDAYMDLIKSAIMEDPGLEQYRGSLQKILSSPTEAKIRQLYTRIKGSHQFQNRLMNQLKPVWFGNKQEDVDKWINHKSLLINRINQHLQEIESLQKDVDQLTSEIWTYMNDPTNDSTENEIKKFIKYTSTQKGIIIFPRGDELFLRMKVPIRYYEKHIIASRISNIQNFKKNILEEVFIKQNYTLWFTNEYKISSKINIIPTDNVNTRENLVNPHTRISCWGGHGTAMAKAIEAGNLIGLIEQLRGAQMNINARDVMFERFLSNLGNLKQTAEVVTKQGKEDEFIPWSTFLSLITQDEK